MSSGNAELLTKIVPNTTPANVYHNADILGYGRIDYAESLGFTHEYDVQLSDATMQEVRYLLLKKLVEKKLTGNKIFKKTVVALAENSQSLSELKTLGFAVGFVDDYVAFIRIKEQKFLQQ